MGTKKNPHHYKAMKVFKDFFNQGLKRLPSQPIDCWSKNGKNRTYLNCFGSFSIDVKKEALHLAYGTSHLDPYKPVLCFSMYAANKIQMLENESFHAGGWYKVGLYRV